MINNGDGIYSVRGDTLGGAVDNAMAIYEKAKEIRQVCRLFERAGEQGD